MRLWNFDVDLDEKDDLVQILHGTAVVLQEDSGKSSKWAAGELDRARSLVDKMLAAPQVSEVERG